MKPTIKEIAKSRVQRVVNGEINLSYAPSQNMELMQFAQENPTIKVLDIMKEYTKEITVQVNKIFLAS